MSEKNYRSILCLLLSYLCIGGFVLLLSAILGAFGKQLSPIAENFFSIGVFCPIIGLLLLIPIFGRKEVTAIYFAVPALLLNGWFSCFVFGLMMRTIKDML